MEKEWRDFLSKSAKVLKMESSFDASSERECSVCLFDLHMSAAGCNQCSPDKYACLTHAKQLCSCSSSAKFFLFRHDIMELNVLVEALEGKLSAVYRWARLDMGLALSSHLSVNKKQVSELVNKASHMSQESAREIISSSPSAISTEEQKKAVRVGSAGSSINVEPPMVVLALESVKKSLKVKLAKSSSTIKKEKSVQLPLRHKVQPCQATEATIPEKASSEASDISEEKQSSVSGNKVVICLSDDEEEEPPSKKPCLVNGTSEKDTISTISPNSTTNSDSCIDKSASTTTVGLPSAVCNVKLEEHAEAESSVGSNPPSSSCLKISLMDIDSEENAQRKKDMNDCDEANAECLEQKQIGDEKSRVEDGCKKLEMDVELRSVENMLPLSSPSTHQNNLDGYRRQKGPRIAKVIRRINCSIETLDFGAVRGGTYWCDNNYIYPKGRFDA